MTLPLITADTLAQALQAPESQRPVVLDTSFDLAQPDAGRQAWLSSRIPGALHVDLERVLSAPKTGRNGRHPLPTPEAFAQALAALGLDGSRPVVAYDRSGGMFAARLWWMLRWVGHAEVSVLDGGLAAWTAAGLPLASGPAQAQPPAERFALRPSLVKQIDHAALRVAVAEASPFIADARAPDRYRGENETLDPVGGHIPGARNRFFRDNLAADGRFKPADALRTEWLALLGAQDAAEVIHQCGSGVTACHNLLALAHAGLAEGLLYPGSWSEWSAQPGAPLATGAQEVAR